MEVVYLNLSKLSRKRLIKYPIKRYNFIKFFLIYKPKGEIMTTQELKNLIRQALENPDDQKLLEKLTLELIRRGHDPRPKNNLLIKTIEGCIISIPKNSFLSAEKNSADNSYSIYIRTSCLTSDGTALTFSSKKEMNEAMRKIIDFLS